VQRSFTGEPEGENVGLPDISVRELATVIPLLGLSLFLGFHPSPVLDRVDPAVKDLVAHVEARTDYKEPAVANEGPLVVESASEDGK
jgi:NADH:ubiquinone oxidoreductase subunit 4 (subunit M)